MKTERENGNISAETNNDNTEEDEELPIISLKNEDKIKVIKGIILLFLFSSVVIYSLIYCNVPMYNMNILFQAESNSNGTGSVVQQYQVVSRHIHKNSIQLQLRDSNDKDYSNKSLSPIIALFLFSKNRMRLKITHQGNDNSDNDQLPLDMFESNDLELKSIGVIDHISESNIGIHINTNPFGFKLFRKQTNETLFSTITNNDTNQNVFTLNKDYMQISTLLCDNHLTFGLRYSNSSLKAADDKFAFWNNWTIDKSDKSFLSLPNFISGNPNTKNFYGSFLFSSSPMSITLENNILTYQIYNNIIDLIIVNGPKPRDIIIQLQKTFGMPFIPSLSSLNWQGNVIMRIKDPIEHQIKMSKVTELDYSSLLFPFKEIWIDDIYQSSSMTEISFIDKDKGIEFIRYLKPIIDITSNEYDNVVQSNVCLIIDKKPFIISNSNQQFCLIDQYNPNTTIYYKNYTKTNKYNLVLQLFDTEDSFNVSLDKPFQENEFIIPLNSTFYDNSKMMDIHNIYSMKQAKNLFEISNAQGVRPMIFSQNTFIGSAQYTGKWLGYFDSSWEGFKYAIRLLGSFGLIHEACGFNLFNAKASNRESNDELCVRWIQFSSVSSFARVNSFETIPSMQQKYKDSILNSIKLREMLSIYIYSTMIRNSYEGGSILFPMFAYFMSNTQMLPVENLFKFEYQFMMGPNIMVCPIVEPNQMEMRIYFPNEIFYNFYTGELVNKSKEQIKAIKVSLGQLPLFTRGGFITPIQIPPPDDKLVLLEDMRNYPIKLIVSLDENYQAQGRLFIDDGVSFDNNYVQIEFVCLYNENDKEIKLLFQFDENDYQIPPNYYFHFNSISFYGLESKPSSIVFRSDDKTIDLMSNNVYNTKGNQMIYNSQLKVLELIIESQSNLMKVNSKKPYHIILKDITLFNIN